jgi:hypothetical protein
MAKNKNNKFPVCGRLWKTGLDATNGRQGGTVVSEKIPDWFKPNSTGHDDVEYYGGFLIAESIANEADAKLIAAAPDLLEALEILIHGTETEMVHGFDNPCECPVCKAKAAVKKATE